MPYLGRRAIENKSVLGQYSSTRHILYPLDTHMPSGNSNTDVERQRIANELKRRLFRA